MKKLIQMTSLSAAILGFGWALAASADVSSPTTATPLDMTYDSSCLLRCAREYRQCETLARADGDMATLKQCGEYLTQCNNDCTKPAQ